MVSIQELTLDMDHFLKREMGEMGAMGVEHHD